MEDVKFQIIWYGIQPILQYPTTLSYSLYNWFESFFSIYLLQTFPFGNTSPEVTVKYCESWTNFDSPVRLN